MMAMLRPWVRRRRWPLLATGLTLVLAMWYSLYWGEVVQHRPQWEVPGDLWFTIRSSQAFLHANWAAVYGAHNNLVTFPGVLVVMAPAAAVVSALHLALGLPVTMVTYPSAWAVAGPYEIVVGSSALFALDAVAERLGTPPGRRALLSLVQAVALASVDVLWGHPEDALGVALLLWAALALHDRRLPRAGWLLGAAVATQPLVLLAVPALVAPAVLPLQGPLLDAVSARRLLALGARAVVPTGVLLAGPLLGAWRVTVHALVDQPNNAVLNHHTPWLALAPRLGQGQVAAGPGRSVAVGLAVLIGLVSWARCRRASPDTRLPLPAVLWAMAVALALRCGFEPLLVAYYVWPALALALALAGRRAAPRAEVAATACIAMGVTVVSLQHWAHPLAWWLVVVGGLAGALAVSRPGPWHRVVAPSGTVAAPADAVHGAVATVAEAKAATGTAVASVAPPVTPAALRP